MPDCQHGERCRYSAARIAFPLKIKEDLLSAVKYTKYNITEKNSIFAV